MQNLSDQTTENTKRGTLRERLLLWLVVALTPILLFAIVQGILDANNSRLDRRNNLLNVSGAAINNVEQTLRTSETLLALFEEDMREGRCDYVYGRVSKAIPAVANAILFDVSGTSVCAATRDAGFEMDQVRWAELLAYSGPTLRSDAFLSASNEWIIGLYQKLYSEDGQFEGLSGFAVRLDLLAQLADSSDFDDLEVGLADTEGKVFGSTRFSELDSDWISEAELNEDIRLNTAKSMSGDKFDVVVKMIGDDKLFAVMSRPSPGLFSEFSIAPARTIGLPLIAFSIALLAAWLAIDYLVLRWLARFFRMARRFGAGSYELNAEKFDSAPQEIAELASAFEVMAGRISKRDTELNAAIDARDAAVKEIHHRVKNNLQIVTSFLNLQSRTLKDEEAKTALSAARHRIDALSIVHQTLYQHERLETVSLKPFLEGLMNHLSHALGMEDSDVALKLKIDEAVRQADDAIPLALFVVEAITNAMKYAFDQGGGTIIASLKNQDTALELSISDDGAGLDLVSDRTPEGTGLGSRLMTAFAKQLGGELEYVSQPGKGYRVTLSLPSRED